MSEEDVAVILRALGRLEAKVDNLTLRLDAVEERQSDFDHAAIHKQGVVEGRTDLVRFATAIWHSDFAKWAVAMVAAGVGIKLF